MSKGLSWETKVASYIRKLGFFTRSNIKLISENFQEIVEVDIIGINLSIPTIVTKIIAECKSGRAKSADIFRILGIAGLIKANKTIFAKSKISNEIRNLIWNNRLKDKLIIIDKYCEFPEKYQFIEETFYNNIFDFKKIKNLSIYSTYKDFINSAIKYLQGDFWFSDDFENIKKLIEILKKLSEICLVSPENELEILKKIFFEAIILLVLCITSILNHYYYYRYELLEKLIEDNLLYSTISREQLKRLENKINMYIKENCRVSKPLNLIKKPYYFKYLLEIFHRLKNSNFNYNLILWELEKLMLYSRGFEAQILEDPMLRKQLQNIILLIFKMITLEDNQKISYLFEILNLNTILEIEFLKI